MITEDKNVLSKVVQYSKFGNTVREISNNYYIEDNDPLILDICKHIALQASKGRYNFYTAKDSHKDDSFRSEMKEKGMWPVILSKDQLRWFETQGIKVTVHKNPECIDFDW